MKELLNDLDAYFCEVYANYDRLCGISGYRMPTMQATKTDEFGRTVAYTLPSNTLRLALQENKESVLALLKENLVDKTFSFSFRPYGFFEGIKLHFSKTAFFKRLKEVLAKHNLTADEAGKVLKIEEIIWKNIVSGRFEPSKNLIFSLAIAQHFTFEETKELLFLCNEEFDYAVEKDVVISYLLTNGVYNEEMVNACLAEYKICNLFI